MKATNRNEEVACVSVRAKQGSRPQIHCAAINKLFITTVHSLDTSNVLLFIETGISTKINLDAIIPCLCSKQQCKKSVYEECKVERNSYIYQKQYTFENKRFFQSHSDWNGYINTHIKQCQTGYNIHIIKYVYSGIHDTLDNDNTQFYSGFIRICAVCYAKQ